MSVGHLNLLLINKIQTDDAVGKTQLYVASNLQPQGHHWVDSKWVIKRPG